MVNPRASVRLLKEALELLGSDFETHMAYLTSSKVRVGIDELALNFHDEALMVPQLEGHGFLAHSAAERIRDVDDLLDLMSGAQNASMWTSEALRSSEAWSLVRRAAHHALTELEDC